MIIDIVIKQECQIFSLGYEILHAGNAAERFFTSSLEVQHIPFVKTERKQSTKKTPGWKYFIFHDTAVI